jgi:hypothetical protein
LPSAGPEACTDDHAGLEGGIGVRAAEEHPDQGSDEDRHSDQEQQRPDVV